MQDLLEKAAVALRKAEALVIAAGAGMGVDSGLPDFRGKEGFWNAYPAYRHRGLGFAQLANPQWFQRDPHFAWGFYGHRLNLYRATQPHRGFEILRKWAQRMPLGAHVFTSNVDGHFQRAGFADDAVAEVHGSIHHLQCALCGEIWNADAVPITVDGETFRAADPLPTCGTCNTIARPNILMFGDMQWLSRRSDAQKSQLEDWLVKVHGRGLAIVECGAGGAIPTVRYFSETVADGFGATLVRINVREPEVPPGHLGIAGGALEVLTKLDSLLG